MERLLIILLGFNTCKPKLLSPVVMFNLLGDIWFDNLNPNWNKALMTPGSKLYLYGKLEPRIGRKMGHINILNNSLDDAIKLSESCKSMLYD